MKKAFIFITFLLAGLPGFAQNNTREAVAKLMKEQEHAWNNYDLRSFMEGYWQSDSLQFVTGKGITYGWENMLRHYLQAYPDRKSTGILSFSGLQFRELSPDYCFVTGKWQISRSAGVVDGLFTLLFKKINGQWKIVVDHTD